LLPSTDVMGALIENCEFLGDDDKLPILDSIVKWRHAGERANLILFENVIAADFLNGHFPIISLTSTETPGMPGTNVDIVFRHCKLSRNTGFSSSLSLSKMFTGVVKFHSCEFSSNTSPHAEDVSSVETSNGGAVLVQGGAESGFSFECNDCIFGNNTASGHAGALRIQSIREVNISTSQFASNSALLDGGAVRIDNIYGSVHVTDSEFTRNVAFGSGAALYVKGVSRRESFGFYCARTSFTENTNVEYAAGVMGGALYLSIYFDGSFIPLL
jgi:hypothetical protein